MNERQLRDALQRTPVDEDARERSRRVVQAAFRELAPQRSRRRTRRPARWSLALAACVVLALATAAVTRAPSDALAQWLRDAVGIHARHAPPRLGALPGGGRLLVTAGDSAWVVAADGVKRRLGRYDGASWSPRGLFVVAWQGGELTALEPGGDVRWSLRRPRAIRRARWAPGDGYRIAYATGSELRVVNGDGTGDRRFDATTRGAVLAWRPGEGHVLAYVDADRRVRVADVDSGRTLWRSAPIQGADTLAWSPRGRRLLVLATDRALLFDGDGARLRALRAPRWSRATAAAWSARGDLALVRYTEGANRGEVVLLDASSGRLRTLFTAPGSLAAMAWSPGGRSLLVAWGDADQLLFLTPDGRQRVVRAVGDVAAQFAPGAARGRFPSSLAWAP